MKKVILFLSILSSLVYADVTYRDGGQSTISSPQTFLDDVPLKFGTGGTVSLLWETADANANALLLAFPEGGAVDVPVFIVGDASALNVDLALLDGITDPTVAILSDDQSKVLKLSHSGSTAVYNSSSGGHYFYTAGAFSGGVDANGLRTSNDKSLILGTAQVAATAFQLQYDTAQTIDSTLVAVDETSRTIHLIDYGDIAYDFALAAQTNPTLAIHSASQSATQYLTLAHNQTNGVITAGAGGISLMSSDATGINILTNASSQLVGSASSAYHFTNSADSIGISMEPHITTTTSAAAFSVINNPFGSSFSASSGTQTLFSLSGTVNQSGTAAFVGQDHNYTLTSVGSGTSYFERFRAGGTSRLDILSTGKILGASTDSGSVDFQTAADHHVLVGGGGMIQLRSSATFLRENTGIQISSTTSKGTYVDGRWQEKQGADVASAGDLTLGQDGNTFEITGTTTINAITTTNWQNGAKITLLFTSNPTVKHNTAGGGSTAVILLSGAADFSATAGDTLTLVYSEIGGTNAWREVSRTVI